MKVLLGVDSAYTDPTSGAARSIKTILQMLVRHGAQCEALSTTRFDSPKMTRFIDHLYQMGILWIKRANKSVIDMRINGVHSTVLLAEPSPFGLHKEEDFKDFNDLILEKIEKFKPDIFLTYGAQNAGLKALQTAKEAGVTTLFSIRNFGYTNKLFFENVDHVLTCSPYLSRYYKEEIDLDSTGIPSPILWSEVVPTEKEPRFLTYVNPSFKKGISLFARLAMMIGERRPDIQIMVVEGSTDIKILHSIDGLDWTKYPNVMAAPTVNYPKEYFALTKMLIVPSVFEEPFGRVAAEAIINGIPPIVSARGALPETIGGAGISLPLPGWLNENSKEVVSELEARPWYDAVTELWDNPRNYQQLSALAKKDAEEKYSEEILSKHYYDYFGSLIS